MVLSDSAPKMASIKPKRLNIMPIGKRRSKFIDRGQEIHQKIMFKSTVAANTITPNVTGCLYQGSCPVSGFGVREETRPLSSASVLVRAVASETTMVITKQEVQATVAIQKFWPISL